MTHSLKRFSKDDPEVQRVYMRVYQGTPQHRQKQKVRRLKFKRTLELWKHTQGCHDCHTQQGKLEYHHLDSSTKRYNVGDMWSYSYESLVDEIMKCYVLCRSCHKQYA
jgi:hypothetical protein